MEITMIRHEKVDMLWEKKYNSVTYDEACEEYDRCPILFSQTEFFRADDTQTVYISELSRTYETARRIFERTDFCKTALLNEVPLRSFKDTEKRYPLWLWNAAGRLQWLLKSRRQAETRKDTVFRARKTIKLLESHKQNCCLVTHGFYMRILIKELKKRGYKIKKSRHFGISNLDSIVAEK